jgi:hypothetical protein
VPSRAVTSSNVTRRSAVETRLMKVFEIMNEMESDFMLSVETDLNGKAGMILICVYKNIFFLTFFFFSFF